MTLFMTRTMTTLSTAHISLHFVTLDMALETGKARREGWDKANCCQFAKNMGTIGWSIAHTEE